MRGLFPRSRTLESPEFPTRVARGNPLADRLCFAWLARSPALGLDLANGIVGVHNGALAYGVGIAKGASAAARSLQLTGTSTATSAYIDFGTPPSVQDLMLSSAGKPCSFAVRAYVNGSADTGAFMNRSDANGSIGWGIWPTNGDGVNHLTFFNVWSGSNLRFVGPNYTAGQWIDFVVVCDGSNLGANQKIYYDGVLQTLSTHTDGAGGSNSDSGQNLYIGRAVWGDSGCIAGRMAFAYIWKDRALTPAEVLHLHLNPYSLIEQPRLQVRDRLLVAAGGSTVNESIALGVQAHFGPASAAGEIASVTLGASAGTTPRAVIAAPGAVTLGGSLGVSESGGIIDDRTIALGVDAHLGLSTRVGEGASMVLGAGLRIQALDEETFATVRRGKTAVTVTAQSGKARVH